VSLKAVLEGHFRKTKISRRLTAELLQRLVRRGDVVAERALAKRTVKVSRLDASDREPSLFGTVPIPASPRPQAIREASTRAVSVSPSRKPSARSRPAKVAAKVSRSNSRTTARKEDAAFMMPVQPDKVLAKIVGSKPLPRTELTRKIWGYIKRNGLQDKKNRRNINADDNMQALFGGRSQVNMFQMTALVAKHVK
jgi:upstream activation factor subunit UAF30